MPPTQPKQLCHDLTSILPLGRWPHVILKVIRAPSAEEGHSCALQSWLCHSRGSHLRPWEHATNAPEFFQQQTSSQNPNQAGQSEDLHRNGFFSLRAVTCTGAKRKPRNIHTISKFAMTWVYKHFGCKLYTQRRR